MALPVVAIIGRPNVGKSSLFNALAGEMISIVEERPGVTRDRVSTIIERDGRYFELVDTGGYGIVDREDLSEHIERQIIEAVEFVILEDAVIIASVALPRGIVEKHDVPGDLEPDAEVAPAGRKGAGRAHEYLETDFHS